jgi:hypothetical protein
MNKRILTAVLASGLAFTAAACSVEKTEEGEAPDVDVEAGKLPEYDVNTPKVEVGTDTSKVITPDIDVTPADSTGQ